MPSDFTMREGDRLVAERDRWRELMPEPRPIPAELIEALVLLGVLRPASSGPRLDQRRLERANCALDLAARSGLPHEIALLVAARGLKTPGREYTVGQGDRCART